MTRYYVDAIGCAATPGAPQPRATRRDAIRAALRAACHAGCLAVIIRADSVTERGGNVYWQGGHVVRAFRGDSPLVRAFRGAAASVDYGEWGRCQLGHANRAYGPHGLCGICLPIALDDPTTAEGRHYRKAGRP